MRRRSTGLYEETDYLCAVTTRISTEPLEGSDYEIPVARQSVGSPDATDDEPAIMKMIWDVNMHDDEEQPNGTMEMTVIDASTTSAPLPLPAAQIFPVPVILPITLPSEGNKVQEQHDDNTERPDVDMLSDQGQCLVLPVVNMNDEN